MGRWNCPTCRALISSVSLSRTHERTASALCACTLVSLLPLIELTWVSSRVRMYGRHKMMQVSIRAGRPGFEKAIIAALPGVPQEMSMSYLLCRSKGAREIVSGAQSVQVKCLDVDARPPPLFPCRSQRTEMRLVSVAQTRHTQIRHTQTRNTQTRHTQTRNTQTRHTQTRHTQTRHTQTRHTQTRHPQTRHTQTRHTQTRHIVTDSGLLPVRVCVCACVRRAWQSWSRTIT
jgi:hypothetical protein